MMNLFEDEEPYNVDDFQYGVKVRARKGMKYENCEFWEGLGEFTVISNLARNSMGVPIIHFSLTEVQQELRDNELPLDAKYGAKDSLCIRFLEVVVSSFELYYNEQL